MKIIIFIFVIIILEKASSYIISTNVRAEVITSSPAITPAPLTAICNAAVPLLVAIQFFVPIYSAHSFCSALTLGANAPRRTPESNTSITAFLSFSVIIGHDDFLSIYSDYEPIEGRYIIPFSYPIIPGHEYSGEVIEIGSEVKNIKVGSRVVGECAVGHGICLVCLGGQSAFCPTEPTSFLLRIRVSCQLFPILSYPPWKSS